MEQAFVDLLRAERRFLLAGHEHPDGDCVGSQAALYHLLKALGKEVAIVNPDPVSRSCDFLLRHTPFGTYEADRGLPDVDVAILLDCAQLSRLNVLGECLRASGVTLAVIDHHVGSEHGDGTVCLVDSKAPATGMLVHRLYRELGMPISAAAAEGIFLSLVSDTGWFRYSNTDAEVLEVAAELVRAGVEASSFYDRIHRRNHVESVDLLQSALAKHSITLGGKYGYACLDKAAMAHAARIDFDTDAVLEPLRSIEGIEVVALFKERFDGTVKLSLRASGGIDVREIAGSFGGGGHVKAAGATLGVSMAQAVQLVRDSVEAALRDAGVLGAES